MVGAGSPIVTVAMAVVFTGTKYNFWTWASMPLICGGLWFCCIEEVHFSLFGTAFAVLAMVLRSAKSIVQAKLLSKQERIEPVTLLYYMAPYAACFVMLMALAVEGVKPIRLLVLGAVELVNGGETGLLRLLFLLVLSGFNACFLNLCGFQVTRCTGAVTLQVLGSVKSCVGIAVSVAILRNPLRMIQVAGMVVCLSGVWIYESRGGKCTTHAPTDEKAMNGKPINGKSTNGHSRNGHHIEQSITNPHEEKNGTVSERKRADSPAPRKKDE
jgi:drug/metabolite transporter (DMT)-like permease